MIFNGKANNYILPDYLKIKKCKTTKDFSDFEKVTSLSYSGLGPNEPYGPFPPEYDEAARRAFKSKLIESYVMLYNESPVACVMIGILREFAGIYAAGVIPSHRGRCYTSIMTKYFANFLSNKRGIKTAFCQTEKDSINEKIFKYAGFETYALCTDLVLKSYLK